MTRQRRRGPRPGRTGRDPPPAGTTLVHSSNPPGAPSDGWVDVRPGLVATFDGDRVRLPLVVAAGRHRTAVGWTAGAELEATVATALRRTDTAAVRFGDRHACRTAVGAAGVAAIERRLAAVARREWASLITWTGASPREGDYRTYDTVVEGPVARFD